MEYFHKQGDSVYWVVSGKHLTSPMRNINKDSYFLKMILPRVKICFVTHEFRHICKSIPSDIIVVNLWHGVALKKMGYDSMLDVRRFDLDEKVNPYLRNDFLISASEGSKKHMESCMGFDSDKVIALGQPRTDILFEKGADKNYCRSLKNSFYNKYKSIFLYAPTFRDSGESGSIYKNVVDSFINYASIDDLLVLRLHPEDKSIAETLVGSAGNVILSNATDPIQDLLVADVLISDYSSIIFDYMILSRPVFLYIPDFSSYMSDRSGFYFDYEYVMRGAYIYKNDLDKELWRVDRNKNKWVFPCVDFLQTKNASCLLHERFH